MNVIEIKLDKSSLPKDGEKIRWQNLEDFDNEVWQEGYFVLQEEIFIKGFEESGDFEDAFRVIHWYPIEETYKIAILHRNTNVGTFDGVYQSYNEVHKLIYAKLKEGKAKLVVDTEETFMYHIKD